MIVPSLEELNSFKYSDLQNLAKSLGLRANLRADKLLRALKAHLKNEARKENENQDEIQTSASSCDEPEIQTSSQEQAEREPDDHVTKTRGRRKTVHRSPDSQANGNVQTEKKLPPVPNLQNHSEIKLCGPTKSQNQEKHENQVLRTAVEVPSLPNESQGDENTVSSGKHGIDAPWTVAHQAPLFMGFSRQEYRSRLPFPTPGDLPDPGSNPASPTSPAVAGRFFLTASPGKPRSIPVTSA